MTAPRSDHPPKTPKVRQSCDTCQASKIRCGQERPNCHRCVKHNIPCVYSVSRRAGRPRPRRTAADATTPVEQASNQAPEPRPALHTPTSVSPIRDGPDCASLVPAGTRTTPVPGNVASPDSSNGEQHLETRHGDALCSELQPQNNSLELFTDTNIDFDPTAYATLSFPESTTGSLHGFNSALPFDLMPSPLQECGDSGSHHDFFLDHFGGCDPSLAGLTAGKPCEGGHLMQDPNAGSGICLCSAMLLQQLTELPISPCTSHKDGDSSSSTVLAAAVQKSKVLLDQCFYVLYCAQCAPKLSSALMLCQAMDALSITLGMGSLWAEGPGDRLPLTSNLLTNEVPLRCGTYSVREIDRHALLRTLMIKRMMEMQRAMSNLYQIMLSAGSASSPCQAMCAGMASDMKTKVTSNVDILRTAL